MSHGRGHAMAALRRGRPRRVAGERATERIWAWVTPSERRALETFAAEAGLELAVVFRDAINGFVAESGERKVFSVTDNSGPCVS